MNIKGSTQTQTPLWLLRNSFVLSPVYTSLLFLLKGILALNPTIQIVATTYFVNAATAIFNGQIGYQGVFLPLFGIFFVQVIQAVGYIFFRLVSVKNTDILERKLMPELLTKIASLEYGYMEEKKSLDLITRIKRNYVDKYVGGINNLLAIGEMAVKAISLIISIIVVASWYGVLVALFCIPLIWAGYKGGKDAYDSFKESENAQREASYFNEVLTDRRHAMERTLFLFYPKIGKIWKKKNDYSMGVSLKMLKKNYFRFFLSSALTLFAFAVFAVVLLFPFKHGSLQLGVYLGIITAVFTFIKEVGYNLSWDIEQFVKTKDFMHDVNALYNLKENQEYVAAPEKNVHLIFSSLEFVNVSFKYPNSNNYTLQNISFRINAKSRYAFVGANGAGKSTIVKLILGLYSEYDGEIMLNGQQIDRFSYMQIKAILSPVLQDFARYETTIRDNVCVSRPSSLDDELFDVLRDVELLDYIDSLPKGIETGTGKVEADDTDLSGGQWQRLAIARALLANKDFLILDEPTASIDPIKEKELYQLFTRLGGNKTLLLISHRLGAITLADTIFVLNNGTIAEQGSHDTLMKKQGLYALMYNNQKGWYQ